MKTNIIYGRFSRCIMRCIMMVSACTYMQRQQRQQQERVDKQFNHGQSDRQQASKQRRCSSPTFIVAVCPCLCRGCKLPFFKKQKKIKFKISSKQTQITSYEIDQNHRGDSQQREFTNLFYRFFLHPLLCLPSSSECLIP